MSNPGVAFDSTLNRPEPNASINGIPFRLNPSSVTLPFSMKKSQTQTLGGMVVQIFGVAYGDLTVQGQFGAGGWREQLDFLKQMQSNVQATIAAQYKQTTPGNSNPSGSYRFLFPLLNYDLQVFLKGYSSIEGAAIEYQNENINPTWVLTFTVDNDNNGIVTTKAKDSYIARLSQGLGYQGNPADLAAFNGSASPNVTNANLQGALQDLFGSASSTTSSILSAMGISTPNSSASGGTAAPTPSGSTVKAADVNMTILGPNTATLQQLKNFWGNRGQPANLQQDIYTVMGYYLSEGQAQNVRGDVAFAQACHETGYFTNSDTKINNFAGIAHYDNAPSGSTFSNVQIGVRAQIQLLYQIVNGNSAPLANPDVSPGWGGKSIQTWAGLTGSYATDPNYAPKIMTIYAQILAASPS